MKKIIFFLATLLLVSACSKKVENTYKMNQEKTTILAKESKEIFNNQDLLNRMLGQQTVSYFVDSITKEIYTLENLESVEQEVNNRIAEYKETLGDSFQTQLQSIGFASEEQFKDSIASRIMSSKLTEEFIKSNKEEYFNNQHPVQLQYVIFPDLETASASLNVIREGISLKDSIAVNPNLIAIDVVVTEQNNNLPVELKSFALTTSEKTTSEIIEVAGANDIKVYYIAQIIENDPNQFVDEAVAEIAKNINQAEVLKYYFKKHNVVVYEQNLYDQLSQAFPGVFE